MLGMPERVSVANSMMLTSFLFVAYSVRYMALPTPRGRMMMSVRYHDVDRVDDGGEYALDVVYDALLAGEELPAQVGHAAVEYVAYEEDEQGADYGGGDVEQGAHRDS